MLPHGEKYHTFPSLHPRRRLLRASTPVYLSVPLRTAPLSVRAAEEVRRYLTLRTDWKTELDKGKMFGVLVVQKEGRTGFLAAYSGILCGRNDHDFSYRPFSTCCNRTVFQDRRSANIPNKPPYRSVGTQRLACLAASTGCR